MPSRMFFQRQSDVARLGPIQDAIMTDWWISHLQMWIAPKRFMFISTDNLD